MQTFRLTEMEDDGTPIYLGTVIWHDNEETGLEIIKSQWQPFQDSKPDTDSDFCAWLLPFGFEEKQEEVVDVIVNEI